MDLSASLRNVNKEKRERQPNWTESEKQLLLCLTEMHKTVLENKGSDTMSIKRKSEAWDEIALRMKAAGFNRSKERLKQQLGRIRAAEAKKMKESMEMYINNQTEHSSSYSCTSPIPRPLQEHQYIKSENMQSVDVDDCIEREIKVNSNVFKPNFKAYASLDAAVGKENKNIENAKILLDGMHFKLHSVQSLAKPDKNFDNETKLNGCLNEEIRMCAADVTSSISNGNLNTEPSTSLRSNQNSICDNNEDATSSLNPEKSQKQQRKRHSKYKRFQFVRQKNLNKVLYTYRIAFERERLRSFKLQQKRDRILYRKDVEIQNLKLQILENIKNQQRGDANSSTF